MLVIHAAFTVAPRASEIGIGVALVAKRSSVRWLVGGQALGSSAREPEVLAAVKGGRRSSRPYIWGLASFGQERRGDRARLGAPRVRAGHASVGYDVDRAHTKNHIVVNESGM